MVTMVLRQGILVDWSEMCSGSCHHGKGDMQAAAAWHLPSQITSERSAHARSSAQSFGEAAATAAIGGAKATAVMILSISRFTTRSMLSAARCKSSMSKERISESMVATQVNGHFMRPPVAAFFSISHPVSCELTKSERGKKQIKGTDRRRRRRRG